MQRKLDTASLLLFAEAWLTVTWVDLAIRLLPFRYWRHWLEDKAGVSGAMDSSRLSSYVQAVERAARHHPFHINCLRRTLALQKMLRRRRLGSRLHIGVRKGNNGLEAHAWLSSGGRVLNDTPDVAERYAELTGKERLKALSGDAMGD